MAMVRKVLLLGLVLGFAVSVVFAGGKQEKGAAGMTEGTVDFWHEWTSGKVKENLDKINALFIQTYPEVKFKDRPIAGGRYEVQRQLGVAFMAGDPPELFNLIPGYQTKRFSDAGRLEPITDVWQKIKGDDIFPKGTASTLVFDGEAWGIPLGIWALNAVWYNVEVFNKYGLKTPINWDDMRNVNKVLTANGVAPFTGGIGGAWCLYAFYPFIISVLGPDGYLALGGGEISWESEEMKKAFSLYKEIWVDNLIAGWSGNSWTDAIPALQDGKAAMYWCMGSWAAGQLASQGMEPEKQFDYFLAPGTRNTLIGHCDTVSMLKGGDAPQGAKKYLEFLASVKAQELWTEGQGIAFNINVPASHYSTLEAKLFEHLQKSDTIFLPNLLFLITPDIYTSSKQEMERYAIEPTTKVLGESIATLEGIRMRDFLSGANVKWEWEK
jgi:ABC-type glycerol-3-phosphate transport system substrate-binding protein